MRTYFSRLILCLAVFNIQIPVAALAAEANKEEKVIKDGSVVSLQYTLSGEDGKLIESNKGKDPLKYTHGQNQIIPGLEKELAGLRTRMTYERLPTAQDVRGSAQGTEENGAITNTPKSAGNAQPAVNTMHPRSGNYKEGDVSIEKFFYMGNKK